MSQISITEREDDDGTMTLSLQGDATIGSVRKIHEVAVRRIEGGGALRVDLSNVHSIDGAALQLH